MVEATDRAIFAPQYYGSIYYYAALWRCREAVVDLGMRYDKRFKSVHRCTIVDTRDRLMLTVPVSRPQGRVERWQQVTVSSHGQWWADHRVSLESAYGRTPYFEFYIDRFKPWLCDVNASITDFDRGIDEVVRRTLGMRAEVRYSLDGVDIEGYTDLRNNRFDGVRDVEYYQVRRDKLGFIPGLSILDLIFNMGPEAPLILDEMVKHPHTQYEVCGLQ